MPGYKFAAIPSRALDDERLQPSDLCVLLAIGNRTHPGGGVCWERSRILATKAHVSHNQFFISAKRLMTYGYLERVKQGKNRGGPSHYTIIWGPTPITGVGEADRAALTESVSATPVSDVPAPRLSVRGSHRSATCQNQPLNKRIKIPSSLDASKSKEVLTTRELRRAHDELTSIELERAANG